jgi:hypothetical protein
VAGKGADLPRVVPQPTTLAVQHLPCVLRALGVSLHDWMPASTVRAQDLRSKLKIRWLHSPRTVAFLYDSLGHPLSRMIATGYDDYTVMAISGHRSTRMLARYTHPTEERKISALDLPAVVTTRSQSDASSDEDASTASEIAKLLKEIGGRQGDRTPDLCIANAICQCDDVNDHVAAHLSMG